jgi:hypothetical protein
LAFSPALISTGFSANSLSGAVWGVVSVAHLTADQFALPFLEGGLLSVATRTGSRPMRLSRAEEVLGS